MEQKPEQREAADKILAAIEREYGFIPPVNRVLGERPDVLVPMAGLGKAVLEEGDLDRKQKCLCAISAATALGGEHCINVQTLHAVDLGATKDEIFEAMMVGAYMAMTRSESYAFRKFASVFDIKLD